MRNAVVLSVLLVAAGASCESGDDGPGPRIDRVAPPQARTGDVVDLLGERFCGVAGASIADGGSESPCRTGFVTFGTQEGIGFVDVDAEDWSDTRISVRVPQLAPGPTSVVVTVNGRQSEVADFEVIE